MNKAALKSSKALSGVCLIIMAVLLLAIQSCETVDSNRIPSMPVYINLSNSGMWSTYGVAGYGDFNYFVFQSGSEIEPAGFNYLSSSATGYGGVLLIEGMDPFSMATIAPLAYDMSCPVEKSRTIRVRIDAATYEAVCPVCDSHYDVANAAGAPTVGPAFEHHYGLRRYYCHPTTLNGYIINDTQ